MKTVGYIIVGVGALLALIAFGFDTAPEGTHNIGLLQQQMMILNIAGILCLGGTLVSCAGIVLSRMEDAGLLPPAGTQPMASTMGDGEL